MGWGELFALASALTWALAVVLLRRSGETLPAFELNFFKNCFGLILLIPTILLIDGLVLPYYTSTELFLVLMSGLLGIAVADTWFLTALNMMGASRTGIVSSLFSPFVVLLSAVFLGERLIPWQWLGFVLVLAGAILVTWRTRRSNVDKPHLRKGLAYAIGAVFMMAVGIVMVKEILENRSFVWTMGLRFVGGIAGMLVFLLVRGRWMSAIQNFRNPQPWGTITLASFLGAYFALILWLAGYKLIDASVASILNETNVVFIVFLAWLILGENINRRKLAGMALTVGGVVIMMLV
jgi:drug/metabolite transporter (DMT)-like permease